MNLSLVQVALSNSGVEEKVLSSFVDLNLSDNSVELDIEWNDLFFWDLNNFFDDDFLVDINDLLLWNWLVDLVDDWDLNDLFNDDLLVNNNVTWNFDDFFDDVFLVG